MSGGDGVHASADTRSCSHYSHGRSKSGIEGGR